jgi:hypothetical protein
MVNKIIEPAYVIDNKDPLLLNRVRVNFKVQLDNKNNISILEGVPEIYKLEDGSDLKPSEKWGKNDPFVFLPLIPLALKTTPKEGEYVNVIWPNPENKLIEQYYIQGSFSSALTMYKEDYDAARMFSTKDRIIDAELLKNKVNNEYFLPKTKGVFIEPDDVGLEGRGSSDLVIKESDILLRAGKSKTFPENYNKPIEVKSNRSFVQLTDLSVNIIDKGIDDVVRLVTTNSYVKTLIEWKIINPENTSNAFNFVIYLYKLNINPNYTTKKFNVDTFVPIKDKSLIYQIEFLAPNVKTKDEVINYINTFISQVNDGEINIEPFDTIELNDQLPCYFRPHPDTYKKLKLTGPSYDAINISEISEQIKFKGTKDGVGLIFFKNKTGPQQEIKIDKVRKFERELGSNTFGIMGADRLLFLSHKSEIPGKPKISLNDSTVYGIGKDFIYENIIPSTNSFVRGEQLMSFMNLVVRFLIGHVHPFPGLPPVPTSIDGVSAQQILIELQNAPNTILNQYIRIN